MAYEDLTKADRKYIREHGLMREKGKPGWKLWKKDLTGTRRKFGLGTTDLEEAKKQVYEAETAFHAWLAKRETTATLKADPLSWDEVTTAYLNRVGKRRGGLCTATKDNTNNVFGYFREFVKEKPPLQITKTDVQAYYDSLTDVKEVTSETYVGRLEAFFNFVKKVHGDASLWHLGKELDIVRVRGAKRARKVYCPIEEISKAIQSCGTDALGMKLKFILFCGFFAGLRKAEISHFRPSWVDLVNKKIVIPDRDPETNWRPKGRKERTIKLYDDFVHFLTVEWTEWQEKGRAYMISGVRKKANKGTSRYDFRKIFKTHMRAIGLNKVTVHTMRHSCSTVQIRNGADLPFVAQSLGDDERTVKDHYVHCERQNPNPKENFLSLIKEEKAA